MKRKEYRSFGVFAGIALGMMLVGALGMNIVPKEYFGVVERFSVFAAVGYNAVLGVELFRMDYLLERRFCKKITVSVHCTIVTVYRKCSGVRKSPTIDIRGAFCTMSYTNKLYECNIKNKRNT